MQTNGNNFSDVLNNHTTNPACFLLPASIAIEVQSLKISPLYDDVKKIPSDSNSSLCHPNYGCL